MKRLYGSLAFVVAALACAALVLAQSTNAPLNNSDVEKLVKSGLSTQVIEATIKSSPANFDTSPKGLNDLKKHHVPDDVILLMVNQGGASGGGSAASAGANGRASGDGSLKQTDAPAPAAAATITTDTGGSASATAGPPRIYIEDIGGFGTYLAAALQKKRVPLTVVDSKSQAYYTLDGSFDSAKGGFLGSGGVSASVRLIRTVDHVVIWAYSVNRTGGLETREHAAEACAGKLKSYLKDIQR
jgi:hypothetical protein